MPNFIFILVLRTAQVAFEAPVRQARGQSWPARACGPTEGLLRYRLEAGGCQFEREMRPQGSGQQFADNSAVVGRSDKAFLETLVREVQLVRVQAE